jgi:dolichol kinase
MSKRQGNAGFLLRKLLHMAVVGAFVWAAISAGRWPALPIAIGCLTLAIAGEWLRTRWRFFDRMVVGTLGLLMTPEERRTRTTVHLNGATWALIAVVLALAVFPMPVSIAALLVLGIGDPMAALVGRTYGRFRIGKKTAEGSVAFIASSLVAVLTLTSVPAAIAAGGCAIATVVEQIPLPGNDNIWITAAAGGGMMLLHWLL